MAKATLLTMAIIAVIVVSSVAIVFTLRFPNVLAYATPYVMGSNVITVRGLGMVPVTTRPRMTDTTGSLALITCVKLPPPFWHMAYTALACPIALSTAIGSNRAKSASVIFGTFRTPSTHIGNA